MRAQSDIIIINGYAVPAPDDGYKFTEITTVDGGRNANNVTVGQIVGRNLWKIEGLQWSRLTPDEWARLKRALRPFYVPVTFTNDYNERMTLIMYPGDRQSTPYRVDNLSFERFRECKFNLVDTGRDA